MTKGVSFTIGVATGVCYAVTLHNLVFGVAIGAALAGVLITRAKEANRDA